MSDRERLVKLLDDVLFKDGMTSESVADYLISAGIVLPRPIEDMHEIVESDTSDCESCKTRPRYPDRKCCFNCKRDSSTCNTWHACGFDCIDWVGEEQVYV